MQVTPNLSAALDRLRLDTETRMLWVDALCINQVDNTERSQQVAQMGKIYSDARETIAWLGRGTTGSWPWSLSSK